MSQNNLIVPQCPAPQPPKSPNNPSPLPPPCPPPIGLIALVVALIGVVVIVVISKPTEVMPPPKRIALFIQECTRDLTLRECTRAWETVYPPPEQPANN